MTDLRCDDDLSDVVVTSQTPIANIDFGRDSYHAERITKHLGISAPWTRNNILDFLQFQADLKDRMAAAEELAPPLPTMANGQVNPASAISKLTAPMREFIAMMVNKDVSSGEIRAELKRIYGVDVSPSHMSHMRKRVFKQVRP